MRLIFAYQLTTKQQHNETINTNRHFNCPFIFTHNFSR
jgi:hypothetical protein